MKQILILGSTGSIGTQTISVLKHLGWQAAGISANTDVRKAEEQIRELRPPFAAMTDPAAAKELSHRVSDTKTTVFSGEAGLLKLIREADFDVAVNGIVGMAGTLPLLEVLKKGKTAAVANKESIVTAGPLLYREAARTGASILPVDSEHSAVFQCLQAAPEQKRLKKIILTASGGPFFGYSKADLEHVTPRDALKHPSWNMGAKITVDCATMMNKGLEIIEAVRLFGVPENQVEVLIHRESIVHSMITFEDHSTLAQIGVPDMRTAIQYALTYPDRLPSPVNEIDLTAKPLTFAHPDTDAFPATELCRQAIRADGIYPTVVNAANETAVNRFLAGEIRFTQIPELVQEQLETAVQIPEPSLETILEQDRKTRRAVEERIDRIRRS